MKKKRDSWRRRTQSTHDPNMGLNLKQGAQGESLAWRDAARCRRGYRLMNRDDARVARLSRSF